MTWHGIYGHDRIVEQFRRAIRRGRLATSFLFAGPEGVGKRTFALKFAEALLCTERPEEAMDPCGRCPSCTQVQALTHPDLEVVSKPADKSVLPLELLIGDKEHRMREGLCHRIGMKPFMGRRKIAIIDGADYLNDEGANSLLKTLEEPPPQSVLILISTSPAKQLPTIRSRCQLVRFQALEEKRVADLLVSRGLVTDAAQAQVLAAHSHGSLQRAMELADPELWAFRRHLYEALASPMLDSLGLAAALAAFVKEAGEEAQRRRARLVRVLTFAAEFYEQLLRGLEGIWPASAEDRALVQKAAVSWAGRSDSVTACVERCLGAAEQVERNANQSTLIECWADDLAALTLSVKEKSSRRA